MHFWRIVFLYLNIIMFGCAINFWTIIELWNSRLDCRCSGKYFLLWLFFFPSELFWEPFQFSKVFFWHHLTFLNFQKNKAKIFGNNHLYIFWTEKKSNSLRSFFFWKRIWILTHFFAQLVSKVTLNLGRKAEMQS